MPDTIEGRLELTKLTQKLDDHIAMQTVDMNEIKATTTRIEAKLDVKANRDDIKDIANEVNKKADRDEFLYWRNLLVSGIIVSILLLLISIFLSIYFKG